MDKSELSAADPGRRRLAAIVALVVGAATIVLAVVLAVTEFPRGLGLLACVVVAGAAAWFGVLRRGTERVVGLAVAGLALVGAVVVVVTGGSLVASVLVIAGLLVSLAAARATLAVHVALPRAPRPQQPVLFYNTRSGGGKAERFARRQGGTGAGDRADRAQAGRRPGDAGPRGGRSRRRRARDGRRRRLAGDRRGDGGRAWFALRVHPRRNAQPLRAGPRRRPRRCRRGAGRVRRRWRADGGPGRGQRARVRQQRLARALCRGGPARGLSRREAAHAARHRAGRARARG